MPGRRSQRNKVASPPQEYPLVESSISSPQAGHPEPPQPDPPTVIPIELHTVSQSTESALHPEQTSTIPSTSPDQVQFAKMSIDDGTESGESSYRTTMPAPEAITFQSPDVLEHDQDDDDDDDDTRSIIMVEPCSNFGDYST